MDPVDRQRIAYADAKEAQEAGVYNASFIILHSENFEGMVRNWRRLCMAGTCPVGALNEMSERVTAITDRINE